MYAPKATHRSAQPSTLPLRPSGNQRLLRTQQRSRPGSLPGRSRAVTPATPLNRAQLHGVKRGARRQALLRRQKQQRLDGLRREILVKLSVNGVLIAVAVAALAKLVPSHWTQQGQLREIQLELASTQGRMERLRSDFNRTFDPMQAPAVMQQQSYRTDPDQRPVVWVEPGTSSGIQAP